MREVLMVMCMLYVLICTMIIVQPRRSVDKTMYIYSSGGGGHKQAMEALKAKDNSNIKKITIDLMMDWLGKLGWWSVRQWNNALKTGDVAKQQQLIEKQSLGNLVFGPIVYQKCYSLLRRHSNIVEIINTQVMCMSSLCDAILKINKQFKRKVRMSLYLTDLPTLSSVHFWNGIKHLTTQQHSILKIYSVRPLVDLSIPLTIIDRPPVRQEFFKGNHKTKQQLDARGSLLFKERSIKIQPNDIVMTLMLGSQCGEIVFNYIRTFLRMRKDEIKFLIFCGSNKNIYNKICNFKKIYALQNQDALAIAEAMERADCVILKTGGLASFEALVMHEQHNQKRFLLHLENDVPVWERGNAQYLLECLNNCSVVNSNTFLTKI